MVYSKNISTQQKLKKQLQRMLLLVLLGTLCFGVGFVAGDYFRMKKQLSSYFEHNPGSTPIHW